MGERTWRMEIQDGHAGFRSQDDEAEFACLRCDDDVTDALQALKALDAKAALAGEIAEALEMLGVVQIGAWPMITDWLARYRALSPTLAAAEAGTDGVGS